MPAKTAIVITTTPTPSPWLKDCLRALEGYDKHQIIILSDYNYETGKIQWMYDHTNIDEFVLMQETIMIKDHKIFDMLFKHQGHSVYVGYRPQHFFMKYIRETLEKKQPWQVTDKLHSVYADATWNMEYIMAEKDPVQLFPEMDDTDVFEEKHGRKNMIIENEYFKKYKGCWNMGMINKAERYEKEKGKL